MHMSVPPETSINDGTDKEEFSPLCYTTIDDEVSIVQQQGYETLIIGFVWLVTGTTG